MAGLKIVVPKETSACEQRVALTPEVAKKLVDMGHSVVMEKGSGLGAKIPDAAFQQIGVIIAKDAKALYKDAQIVVCVAPPETNELSFLPEKACVIGLLRPYDAASLIKQLSAKKLTGMALEWVPRISRAQSMDVLSSQSNLAGYRAVIEAAAVYGRSFPLMMTAAGTIPPARVLVLGAGVAGLQAIATARRLGAIVSAYDVRSAAKEQVESLGATFVEVAVEESGETTGGYAKDMSAAYKKKQAQRLAEVIPTQDIIITTALIPGKPAPILITEEMVATMKPGSVIVDLAAEAGGNCASSDCGKVVVKNDVTLIGYLNIPSRIAFDASQVYARNMLHFLKLLLSDTGQTFNFDDEIIQSTLLTREGAVIHPLYQKKKKETP